jgi:hypothetical protein
MKLLTDFEPLFDGTFGARKTMPISFKIKQGAGPYHGWVFPIPKFHKETIMKEIKLLIELGVLGWQPLSKWAAQSFIQPKKNGMAQFLTDFRELNIRPVRKPFPLPKLVLSELEGLTVLDLIMGYSTIRLDPDASRIYTIIFPGGKYLQEITNMCSRLTRHLLNKDVGTNGKCSYKLFWMSYCASQRETWKITSKG